MSRSAVPVVVSCREAEHPPVVGSAGSRSLRTGPVVAVWVVAVTEPEPGVDEAGPDGAAGRW